MRCPNCGGEHVVLAAPPGERPDRICVCLGCAHLWDRAPDERHARRASA